MRIIFSYVAVEDRMPPGILDGDIIVRIIFSYVAVADVADAQYSDIRKHSAHYFPLCRRRGCRPGFRVLGFRV